MTAAGRTLRVLVGSMLAWWTIVAVAAPEAPRLTVGAAVTVAAATLWNPAVGLMLVAALTPAGALLAAAPVRAPEIVAWTFLAAWLLSVWRPISHVALPRTVAIAAALYGAALVASWLMLTLGAAAGVSTLALPQHLFRTIPRDHLIFSSPEPETWTLLQMATGVAVLFASMSTIAPSARFVRALAWTLVCSIGFLAAATLVDVGMQWSRMDYGGWFLLRYAQGERFSLHLADLNAAGSLYVLAATGAAAVAALDPRRRGLAIAILIVMLPALWLTGSRTSFVAMVVGLLILAVAQHRRPLTRSQLRGVAVAIALLALAGALTVDWQSAAQGSASRSASLRSQFMQTSARMFASAPVFGVGVGRYFDRSAEFMPEELRTIYGNENAHNYFVQQFAELGLVGGALFLWLAWSLVTVGWRAVRASAGDAALDRYAASNENLVPIAESRIAVLGALSAPKRDRLTSQGLSPSRSRLEGYQGRSPWWVGLFAGVGAYLLTCLTGHPLLVPEAAFPFWIAAGAVAGTGDQRQLRWGTAQRALVVAASVVLASGIARQAVVYSRATVAPPEQGFHGQEPSQDGSTFRWMTRHGVTYAPNEPGFLRLRLHAPDFPITRPLVIETAMGGVVVDRREIPAGRWVSYDIPTNRSPNAPFRRVDLRVNQWWMQDVALGMRQARRPIAIMVGEIRWIPLSGVG